MTGAWLLTNNLEQISDCTGGRIDDAVRYCQSEQRYKFELYKYEISMKFINLKLDGENIAVNRDAIAYVKQRGNQAIIFLNVINKDDRLKHIAVDEDYDIVVAMLNS